MDEKHLLRFQSETSVFKSSSVPKGTTLSPNNLEFGHFTLLYANDGEEMYHELQRTCRATVFSLIFCLVRKPKGPGKRGHIVADTLLTMMFLGLRKLGNIYCGTKCF